MDNIGFEIEEDPPVVGRVPVYGGSVIGYQNGSNSIHFVNPCLCLAGPTEDALVPAHGV